MNIYNKEILRLDSPLQSKHGTSAALEASDYILAAGEILVATDTGEIKGGKGIHTWSQLPSRNSSSETITGYTLTYDELVKLRKLLDSVFSGGTDVEIRIPTFDDIYGGLPKRTVPEWQAQSLPDGYEATAYKMYYGHMPYINIPTPDSLLVVLSANSFTGIVNVSLENGMTVQWQVNSFTPTSYIYKGKVIYVFDVNSTTRYALRLIRCQSERTDGSSVSMSSGYSSVASGIALMAMCESSALSAYIVVAKAGAGYLVKDSKSIAISPNVHINPGCAAWSSTHQVFCLCVAD